MNRMALEEGPKNPVSPNSYATKKTISQGMFDVALLTANASQLKYCLQLGEKNKFYLVMVCLISTSIILQILVGVIFIYVGYSDFDQAEKQKRLNRFNNCATILVFLITIINVLISGFGISTEPAT